jgi:formate--tetrahydrofolate ligase
MGLRSAARQAVALCLREPSLGPVFGVKGGGTGRRPRDARPLDDINLHFTGDIHAITSAHNLLSAMIDNALHFATAGRRRPSTPAASRWAAPRHERPRAAQRRRRPRRSTDGVPARERFDITAASEVMAILASPPPPKDLEAASRASSWAPPEGKPVTAGDLGASAAMTALLRDASSPTWCRPPRAPALVHAGPSPTSPTAATRSSRRASPRLRRLRGSPRRASASTSAARSSSTSSAARSAGMFPRCVVLVATLRALKMHGGVPVKATPASPTPPRSSAASSTSTSTWRRLAHLRPARGGGHQPLPQRHRRGARGVSAAFAARGARRGRAARASRAAARARSSSPTRSPRCSTPPTRAPPARYTYELDDPPEEKIRKVARRRLRRRRTWCSPPRPQGPRAHRSSAARAPRVHGQDAALAQRRRPSPGRPRASRSPCARCA